MATKKLRALLDAHEREAPTRVRETLARARSLARATVHGTSPEMLAEAEMLDSIRRVAKLPMHEDVRFVLGIVEQYLSAKVCDR